MSIETSKARGAEKNAAIFRRIIEEGFNQGNLAILADLVALDIKEHQHGAQSGLEGLKATITELRRDIPDLEITIEDVIADGDRVCARLRGRGSHRAGFFGLPRTGRPITVEVIDICRFEGGKMVEHWGIPDRFAMLEQIGLLPRPNSGVKSLLRDPQ